MFTARAIFGVTSAIVAALCSSCSLQKYLERLRAALNEAGQLLVSVNLLKTKRRLLDLKTQFVPRSKHFSSWL